MTDTFFSAAQNHLPAVGVTSLSGTGESHTNHKNESLLELTGARA